MNERRRRVRASSPPWVYRGRPRLCRHDRNLTAKAKQGHVDGISAAHLLCWWGSRIVRWRVRVRVCDCACVDMYVCRALADNGMAKERVQHLHGSWARSPAVIGLSGRPRASWEWLFSCLRSRASSAPPARNTCMQAFTLWWKCLVFLVLCNQTLTLNVL